MAVLDWNTLIEQAKAEGFSNEVVPAGKYAVEVASVKVSPSKNGVPSIGVRLTITEGPHEKVSLWDNLYVTPDKPKGMAMFFRKAVAYGADMDAFKRGESLEQIANSFVGVRGIAEIEIDTYNQQERNKVAKFTPSTGGFVATPVSGLAIAASAPTGLTLPPMGSAAGGFSF